MTARNAASASEELNRVLEAMRTRLGGPRRRVPGRYDGLDMMLLEMIGIPWEMKTPAERREMRRLKPYFTPGNGGLSLFLPPPLPAASRRHRPRATRRRSRRAP